MEEDTGDPIRITHFINPYNFWYLTEEDVAAAAHETSIQNRVNDYGNKHHLRRVFYASNQTVQRVGNMVLVYQFQLQQWMRCVVDEVLKDITGEVICFLWAIDVGIPLKTMCNQIYPLPATLGLEPPVAKRGALADVIPTEWFMDYAELRMMPLACPVWSAGVSNNMQTLLEDAASVQMQVTNRLILNETEINFGKMSLKTLDGQEDDVIDMLVELGADLIRWSSNDFLTQFVDSCEHASKRYLKPDGEEITTMNNWQPERDGDRPSRRFSAKGKKQIADVTGHQLTDPPIAPDADVCLKVWAWQKRNASDINGGDSERTSLVAQQSANGLDKRTQPPVTIVKKQQPKVHPKLSRIIAAQQQMKGTNSIRETEETDSQHTVKHGSVTSDTADGNDAAKVGAIFAKLQIKRNNQRKADDNTASRYVEKRQHVMVPAGMDMGNVHFENGNAFIDNRRWVEEKKRKGEKSTTPNRHPQRLK